MYRVTLYDNPYEENGTIIHQSNMSTEKIEGTIKKDINLIESFQFSFTLNNPGYGKIRPLKTFVTVLNTRTGEREFKGRVLSPIESMDEQGMVSTAYVCEGEGGYLHDSVSRHLEWRGTPKNLLQTILNWHNEQTEEYKHFKLGRVEVTNSTDNMYVYLSAERTTYEEIQDKFLDRLGGEFQIRTEGSNRYLDYMQQIGEESDTEIRLAKNLMSISKEVDPTEIVTRLTPLGERIESEDEEASDVSEARLTIESVNGGVPYIDRPDLIAEFGVQGHSEVWDDVTVPQNLLTKGREFLNNQKLVLNKFVVSALDLSVIGQAIDAYKLGWSYPVWNPVMSIDERLRVIGVQIDINTPENSNLTIGDKFKTLREYQADMNRSTRRINELQGRIDSLSRSNIRLNSSLQDAQIELESIRTSLTNVDLENLPQELQSIGQQLLALEQLLNNIDIPEYDLATPYESGLMSSQDKTKLDLIHTTKIVNLDDVLARLEALETPEPPTEPEEEIE